LVYSGSRSIRGAELKVFAVFCRDNEAAPFALEAAEEFGRG
jgi:hypothetical protein